MLSVCDDPDDTTRSASLMSGEAPVGEAWTIPALSAAGSVSDAGPDSTTDPATEFGPGLLAPRPVSPL